MAEQLPVKTPFYLDSLFLGVLIIFITCIALFPSLKNGFVQTWDDGAYVVKNQAIQTFNQGAVKAIFTTPVAGSYVPIPLLTYALEFKIFGLNPFVFHLSNLLLHLLCTFLVFILLRKLKLAPVYAAIGSLIFGIHPMHVESVAWITERKDLLFCLFYLISMIVYVHYVTVQKKTFLYLFLCLFFFVLSLFSKITAVTLPISLLLVDYYLERPFKKNVYLEKIPFFILSLAFGIAEIIIFQRQGLLKTSGILGITDKVFLGFYALSAYIIKFFTPFHLSAIYPYLNASGNISPFFYYTSPILILFLGFLTYYFRKKNRAILFGILFFFINIILMLQAQIMTIGVGYLADRFSYLPYLGICFLVGWASEQLASRNKEMKNFLLGALLFIILIYSAISFNRTKIWENDFTLWNDATEKFPNSERAYALRGIAFTNIGQWNNAINDFNKALEIYPNYGWVYTNCGIAYQNIGEWNKSVEDFSKAIIIDSNDIEAYSSRGVSYGVLGQLDQAIVDLSKTIHLNPQYTNAYSNRGLTYASMGFTDKAIVDYSKAIEIDPGNKNAYFNRSIAFGRMNEYNKAIEDVSKAISLDPGNTLFINNYGYYYLAKGDIDHAKEQFHHCIQLDEKKIEALFGLAMAYYIDGDLGNAKNYLTLATHIDSRLNHGIEGIKELENIDYLKQPKAKEIIREMIKVL